MSSPRNISRQNSFLLMQDEPFSLGPKTGTLAALMRRRPSATSVHHYRDEEEAGGSGIAGSGAATPSRGSGFPGPLGHSPDSWRREYYDDDDARRHDERRLSALLNNPQMRSMRLIGKAKRYRWERYWKTEEQLSTMKAPLFVFSLSLPLCLAVSSTTC